jgi:hypothetical protein
LKYRTLAVAPLVFVAVALAAWGMAPVGLRPSVLVGAVESAKVLALVGCLVAAWTFEPGDYLRRAWLLLAACTVLLFARDVVALAGGPALAQGVLATAGNASSVVGTWILARAWTVAGLDVGDAPTGKWPMRTAAVAVALAVTGWPLVGDLGALARGDAFAVVPLVSDVADTVVLALLAPILRTTLALQGGVLRWPWALMTVGNLLWLVFDALYGVLALLEVDPSRARVATEALRVAATLYLASAGIAQRRAVKAAAAEA